MHGYISRRNQNTPPTNHRKDLSPSKGKLKTVILDNSSPCRYDDNETKHIAQKNSEINPILVSSVLEFK